MLTSYLKYQEEYSEKYGDKTIVLMQVGSFYESYSYDPEKDESNPAWPDKKLGHTIEAASLLNMVVTRKDKKKPYSITNCDMFGFPIVALEKHKAVLLFNNYTIVRVDQKKDDKNNVERFVAEIVSPATQLENISSIPVTNNIVSIFIEVLKESYTFEDYSLAVGISSIDLTTGENSIFETYSKETDNICPIQEVYRYLSSCQPRELIINLIYKSKDNIKDKVKDYEKFLISSLNLETSFIFFSNKVDPDFLKVDYSTKFLTKIFSPNTINNPNIIEELGLERIYYGMVSYILLLQYCYEHNPCLIEKLDKPNTSFLDSENYLILTHNAIQQLDILPNSKTVKHNRSNKNIDSLFSVVNFTKTALGKRYLLKMLLNPITNTKTLNETYDMVEYIYDSSLSLPLKDIPDLERYQRKLYLKIIKPNEFSILFKAYISIVSIYGKLVETPLSKILFNPTSFNECLSLVLSKYKLDALAGCKLQDQKLESEEKIFYDGRDEKTDNYFSQISQLEQQIQSIVQELNSHLIKTKGKKLEHDKDKDKIGFVTTPHKASVLSKSSVNEEICGKIQTVNMNKEVCITSDVIAQTCEQHAQLTEELSKYLYSCYMSTLHTIAEKFHFFSTINLFIAKLDYICSNAKCALENRYFRPNIVEDKSSFLEITDMRHPIVEALISNPYITNDICLRNDGMLLYGMNSCGKSTMAKAIALNIILAQAGLFTSGQVTFSPYNKIITRLSGHDSITTGESSFIIEMKELRTILRQSDDKTLVVADELCRGTESISATSLTVSAIQFLIEKKSSFIFSSHNHALVDMEEIKDMKICHLSLRYDPETKTLIYDRKLKEGSGDSVYGLEVANSLGLDGNYIRKAYELRNKIIRENPLFLSTKRSKYNNKVFVDTCFLCGTRELDKLQTHHIVEQHNFGDDKRKNIPGNLIEICNKCHEHLHANGLSIISNETNKGISLSVM